MDAQAIIAALKLEMASSDTERALVLDALMSYCKAVGLTDLHDAAKAARPAAHPFKPPKAWRSAYLEVFEVTADPDCGVDPDEGQRYSAEFWQSLTDAQRHERLGAPWLGREDGEKDAEALNEA